MKTMHSIAAVLSLVLATGAGKIHNNESNPARVKTAVTANHESLAAEEQPGYFNAFCTVPARPGPIAGSSIVCLRLPVPILSARFRGYILRVDRNRWRYCRSGHGHKSAGEMGPAAKVDFSKGNQQLRQLAFIARHNNNPRARLHNTLMAGTGIGLNGKRLS